MTSAAPMRVVGLSGSLTDPSRTTALVEAIVASVVREAAASETAVDAHLVTVSSLAPSLGVLTRKALPAEAQDELRRIEEADLLVVATPVYRASYTGLFKHIFDFIGQDALVGTPVLLAATGGSQEHSLIIEHELRPLFGFFRALTLPVGIYAQNSDFVDGRPGEALLARIDAAVANGLPLVARAV